MMSGAVKTNAGVVTPEWGKLVSSYISRYDTLTESADVSKVTESVPEEVTILHP